MSDKTKLQWINGSIIKQGDTSSIFKLKLRTEDRRELNGPAKIQLIHQTKGMIEFEAEVVDDVVSFRLEKALPIGSYIVEVEHAGYVFPSTNSVVLTVNENLGDVITDEVAELLTVDEYISQKLADYQSGQIDLDELASKIVIPQYDDSQMRAEIADILAQIDDMKQSEGNQTSYDDSELRAQISALSERLQDIQLTPGPVGPQGEPGMDGQDGQDGQQGPQGFPGKDGKDGQPGQDGKSAYQIALDNGFEGSEQEWLESLKAGNADATDTRFGPTGWFLDRSVSPWQFRFDNGSSLTLGNVDQRAYIYAESAPLTQERASEYRVITTLMRFAMGSNTLTTVASLNGIARFWGSAEVSNPVNDSSAYNFANAYFNVADTSGPSKRAQATMIRCYYELAVFTAEDILSLGAVRL
ncbi:TPA: hypothetical protein ACGO17_000372 [Streptococcus suis]